MEKEPRVVREFPGVGAVPARFAVLPPPAAGRYGQYSGAPLRCPPCRPKGTNHRQGGAVSLPTAWAGWESAAPRAERQGRNVRGIMPVAALVRAGVGIRCVGGGCRCQPGNATSGRVSARWFCLAASISERYAARIAALRPCEANGAARRNRTAARGDLCPAPYPVPHIAFPLRGRWPVGPNEVFCRLAVPGKCCGLTLTLAFSDRCG